MRDAIVGMWGLSELAKMYLKLEYQSGYCHGFFVQYTFLNICAPGSTPITRPNKNSVKEPGGQDGSGRHPYKVWFQIWALAPIRYVSLSKLFNLSNFFFF